MDVTDGLAYVAQLPFAWQPLPALPAGEAARQQSEAARDVLRMLLTLALGPGEAVDDGSATVAGERSGELLRLERKLDLALELLGRLLARAEELPPVHEVRLTADALLWQSAEILTSGPVSIELHLDPRYPLPLRLCGHAQVEGEWIRVGFGNVDPALHDALERLIFLYHRRRLGRERRPAGR